MIKKIIAFLLLILMLPFITFSSYLILSVSAAQELWEIVILEQDFEGLTELPDGWFAHRGDWTVSDGKLRQTYVTDPYSDPAPAVLRLDEILSPENFRFEATVQFESAALAWSWIGLGFDMHYKEPFTYAGFSWETSNSESIGVTFGYYSDQSAYSQYSAYGVAPKDMSDGEPVRVRIEVRGEYGDIYFNDSPVIINAEIPRWEDGTFGLVMGYGATGSYSDIRITKLPDYPLSQATGNYIIDENYKSTFNGGGIDFSTGNIELVSNNKFPASPKTFEAWVKIPVDGGQRDGVIAGNGAIDGINGTSTINFGVKANGNPWLYWKEATGNVTDYAVPANVKIGDWVHIAIVQDSENHKLFCYINGNMANERLSSIVNETIPIRALKIGGDYLYNNPRYFPGEIAEIRVWSRALNQEEIQAHMNAKLTGSEDGLMANWRLGDELPDDVRVYQEWLEPKFAKGDYSIAVVPDIQYMTRFYPDTLDKMVDWIRDNAGKLNIKFMIQVGDLTDANTGTEWARVRDNFAKLDDVVPYAFVPGNHDYAGIIPAMRDTSTFNIYLPYSKYSQMSYFGGTYEEGKMDNTYYFFKAGNTEYMILCLEMTPRGPVIDWANKIITDNPDCSVIVATHSYLSYTGEHDNSNGYDITGNSGKGIWENLASLHENIIMVLSGHIHYDDIVMRADAGINGNIVHQFLTDIQTMDYYQGGIGMIALMTFSNNGRDVAVNWYSTKEDALFRDWNQFSFKIGTEPKIFDLTLILIIGGIVILGVLSMILVVAKRRSVSLKKS